MDSAYSKALRRKHELERELAEIEAFLKMYARFSTSFVSEDLETTMPKSGAALLVSRRAYRPRANPAEFAELAGQAIREAKRPLSRTELVEILENQRGIDIPSQDKPRYIGTILWRNRDKFINIPGKGYQLADLMTEEEIAEQFAALAQDYLLTLNQDDIYRLKEIMKTENSIPSDIDSRLLAQSRDKALRHFSDVEKKLLRTKFREAVSRFNAR